MNGAIIIGIPILAVAILGLFTITIPAIQNILSIPEKIEGSETAKDVAITALGVAVSGFLLWFTTGLIIAGLIGGGVFTIIGIVDN
jgi:hypothetical protein